MTENNKNLAPFVVFEGSAWEAGLLKSILEDNNIETIMNEAYSLPWNTTPTRGAAARLFVAFRDLERAKEVVDEFYSNMQKKEDGEE